MSDGKADLLIQELQKTRKVLKEIEKELEVINQKI